MITRLLSILCVWLSLSGFSYLGSPNQAYVLAKSAVAINTPADTTEDTLVTVTLPALGVNSEVIIESYWSINNNANTKTPRVKIGGGTIGLGVGLTSQVAVVAQSRFFNRNALNSQLRWSNVAYLSGTSGLDTNGTLGIDTSTPQNVTLTCQKAVAGDTCTLEGYLIIVIP